MKYSSFWAIVTTAILLGLVKPLGDMGIFPLWFVGLAISYLGWIYIRKKEENPTSYRVGIPDRKKNQTVISNFEAPTLAKAVLFAVKLAAHYKTKDFLLQKKIWWIFYEDIKAVQLELKKE